MKCSVCGRENDDSFAFCVHCGANLKIDLPNKDLSTNRELVNEAFETPTIPPSQEVNTSRKRSVKPVIFFSILGLLLLCVLTTCISVMFLRPEWIPFPLPIVFGVKNNILLGFPSKGDKLDLYMVALGKEAAEGVLLAEDIAQPGTGIDLWQWMPYSRRLGGESLNFGGFVPNSNQILLSYLDDDEAVLAKLEVNSTDINPIFISKHLNFQGYVMDRGETIFIAERRGNSYRCYISQSGQEAARITQGDWCWISLYGATVLAQDYTPNGYILRAMDNDGNNEVVLLDEEQATMIRDSPDGSHVAILYENNGQVRTDLMDWRKGDVHTENIEAYDVLWTDMSLQGNYLFQILEGENGELKLYTLDQHGLTTIAEGNEMNAAFSRDGKQLIYLTDEEGDKALYVHPMSGGEDIRVLRGENLHFIVLYSPDRILIMKQDDGELEIYSAEIDGSNIVRLLSEESISLADAFYKEDERILYLLVRDDERMHSLFVTPIDQDTGTFVINKWSEVSLLNRSTNGEQIVFSGREDYADDLALFSVSLEDRRPHELDDDFEQIVNSVFATDNAYIIYTVITGSDPDDIEVRKVPSSGEEHYEAIYEEAFLIDVQWDETEPFFLLTPLWQRDAFLSTSFCPGASTLSVGEVVEDELVQGERNCYRFRVEGSDIYTFVVESISDLDPRVDLYDREGNYLDGDDDSGFKEDPLLRVKINQSGMYFVTISGETDGASGNYNIQVFESEADTLEGVVVPIHGRSEYSSQYYADIDRVEFGAENFLVFFEAKGYSDLRRPEDSCVIEIPTGQKFYPADFEFPVYESTNYRGYLSYPIDIIDPDYKYSFRYSCFYGYSDAELFNGSIVVPSSREIESKVIFSPVNILPIANWAIDHLVNPPTGNVSYEGVPFTILSGEKSIFQSQNIAQTTHPTQASLIVNINKPKAVYILLNGGYVDSEFRDRRVGEINFTFDDGSIYSISLIAWQNIRENWAYENDIKGEPLTTRQADSEWKNVLIESQYRGSQPAQGFIDMIIVPIPEAFSSHNLVGIDIVDASMEYVDSLNPSLVIMAITVESY